MISSAAPYMALIIMLLVLALPIRKREKRLAAVSAPDISGACPKTTFSDVAANDEALTSLRDLVLFIKRPEIFKEYGARVPRGVLLYGPPGTGKTLMARALAGEAGAAFFAANGADFVEMYVGVGASRVRKLFAKARKAGRAVIFIDEIDAIGKKRDSSSDEREQTLNALLSEMSGFQDDQGVIVLAATNRVDTLDEALLRAGRFDRQIEVPLPGLAERRRILDVHVRNKPLDGSVQLDALAERTAMFSGASLESMLNEAAILAAKRGSGRITQQDVSRAFETIVCGMDKNSRPSSREREITAAHEAGHALVTHCLLPENRVSKVSIIPSTKGAAGYSMATPPERMFHTRNELICHIAALLAGRAAEEKAFGTCGVTTGASGDLEKAASIARSMVCDWGMLPDDCGLYCFSQSSREAAMQKWLAMGQSAAKAVLDEHEQGWRRLAATLLARESVDGETVAECAECPERGGE